ncbi:DNA alkylation repair protein [Mangrovimonas aestuarii]|uniref:DNA alkylation repair protein n=1 Tax=Mangrovimonas aestuarii TaxID=3018443 RepID=UPI0023799594|nr:DNA alkylation repair protein [Mangrovimonas aestuarii]
MNTLIEEIKQEFTAHANPEEAAKQTAYLKGKFPHFGLKTPQRRTLTKPLIDSLKPCSESEIIEICRLCYDQPEREFHQLALDILVKYHKKLEYDAIPFIKKMIEIHSWWDTVDMLAAKVLGNYLKRNPEQIKVMDSWCKDDNLWIRRSALLFQLKYKEDTDSKLLFKYCLQVAHEKDFFIRKAIGWTLREYAKTNRDEVEAFVNSYREKLSHLTVKEALR